MTNQLQNTGDPVTRILMNNPHFWKHFPYFSSIYEKMIHNTSSLMGFFDKQIAEHRKQYKIEGDPETATNYVQAFLMEANRKEEKGEENTFS